MAIFVFNALPSQFERKIPEEAKEAKEPNEPLLEEEIYNPLNLSGTKRKQEQESATT